MDFHEVHFCFTLVCFHPMSNYFFYSFKFSVSSIIWIWESILDQHTQHYGVYWTFTPSLCIKICYGVYWNSTPTSCIQIWRYYQCTFSSFDSLFHWVFQILILQIAQNDLKWHKMTCMFNIPLLSYPWYVPPILVLQCFCCTPSNQILASLFK
jgi:hypothetical protein